MNAQELAGLRQYLTQEELLEFDALLAEDLDTVLWRPIGNPQTLAYYSEADVIGFGGAAGGGKTDLACGKGLTQHERIAIFRREGTELTAIVDRLQELLGSRDGYNGQDRIWRLPDRQIELCSVPNLGDEKKYQGRPKDLLVLDEAANFLEAQARFLMGWVRSTTPGQKSQTLMTFNPPTSAEGRWIVAFFAPWIDKRFPGKRAKPGEIRYVGVIPTDSGVSRDVWVDDGRPFIVVGGEPCYDFDPAAHSPEEIIKPQTRTFIPSRITDNPFLRDTGYMSVLQALPEPLRSQMLYGDFEAGMEDDPWQVIPTAWVEAAMDRWKPRSPRGEMMAMGVDVARGGRDSTVIATRHAPNWYDKLLYMPGTETPDGETVAAQVIAKRKDSAPIFIDAIGVGASPYDILRTAGQQVMGVNVSEKSTATDRSGRLRFLNQRAELWWKLREELDPVNDTGVELHRDPKLLADLTAPRWSMAGMRVQVESTEEIKVRIGRSPDAASALILARLSAPKIERIKAESRAVNKSVVEYDPLDHF